MTDYNDDAETPPDDSEKASQTSEDAIFIASDNKPSAADARSLTRRASDSVRTRLPAATRVLIRRYTSVILAVFVVVAALGVGGLYVVSMTPDTTERTETVAEWSTSAAFSHSAVVQSDTTVFSSGERLTDRSLYFTRTSPTVDGEYVISHDGQVTDGTGNIDLWLVLRSSEQRTVDGERRDVIHWERREELATVDAQPFASGDEQRVSFSVNTSGVREQLAQIETELGASPGTTEAVVVSEASFTGVVGGERLSETRSDRFRIEFDSNTFGVASDIEQSTTQSVTEVVTTPVTPPVLLLYAGASAVVVGLVGGGSLLWLNSAGAFTLSPAERRRREYHRTRNEYDQWICRGHVPEIENRTVIELDTMADAVTVAMSNESVVIEQLHPVHEYVVLQGDIVYRFASSTIMTDDADGDSDESGDQNGYASVSLEDGESIDWLAAGRNENGNSDEDAEENSEE